MDDAIVATAAGEKSLLRFTPLTSFVNSSFWFRLADLKLNQDMLNEVTRYIWGYYSHEEKTGSLLVDCSSFNKESDNYSSRSQAHGCHMNMNTIERFINCDKQELLANCGQQLLKSMESGEALSDPSKLVQFLLLTYADLKKYTFNYWFAFPAILDYLYYVNDSPKNLESVLSPDQVRSLSKLHKDLPENQKGFFCFELKNSEVSVSTIKDFVDNYRNISQNTYIAFLDPTTLQDIPGWPLRNLLSLLKLHCETIFDKTLKVVSIRGGFSNWINRSVVFTIQLSEKSVNTTDMNKIIGWEKNSKGKLSPRLVNLADDMDPVKLSSRAVDLNLKLVKWRLQPDLDLSVVKNTSCLLLGAGTLGCSVARVLLAWGVQKITFVDNGVISYSNPARQSLYTFKDSGKNKAKATAAAAALTLIHPGVSATGEVLRIPTPGLNEYDLNHIHKLQNLVETHDVVFLVTDSRESRWLPTLLSSSMKKIAITIALGYDSYLVIRHGISAEKADDKLGCYFCNDIVVPGNSQIDRTLDQQCTVTRPGISGIAASFGVELLMSLLQHPKKGSTGSEECSCLGKIPHSIRGFISDYEHMYPSTPAFDQCIACSPVDEEMIVAFSREAVHYSPRHLLYAAEDTTLERRGFRVSLHTFLWDEVINEYLKDGDEFLKKVFSDAKYLENVTALSQYQLLNDELEFPELSDEDEIQ